MPTLTRPEFSKRLLWSVVILSFTVLIIISLLFCYWYINPLPSTFSFGLRQVISKAANKFFPDRFPSPYGDLTVSEYVPGRKSSSTVRVLRGVIEESDSTSLTYSLDVSGSTYLVRLDEESLRTGYQNIIVPVEGGLWKSIVIPSKPPYELLCVGDVVEVGIEKKFQQSTEGTDQHPFIPGNIIITEVGPGCPPRKVHDQK